MAILNFSDVLKNVGLDPKRVKLKEALPCGGASFAIFKSNQGI